MLFFYSYDKINIYEEKEYIMGIDFNKIFITGRVYGMDLSPMKTQNLYVAEGKLCVNNAMNANGEILRDDFPVRCYGKQAELFGQLKDGTHVLIEGKLKEDIRVNANDPKTVRSKVYINVLNYKIENGDKDISSYEND